MNSKDSKKIFQDLLRASALTVFFVASAVLLGNHDIRRHLFDLKTIDDTLNGNGTAVGIAASAMVFILAASSLIALGVPRLMTSAVGGAIYGAVGGTVFSLVASLLGSSILYLVSRGVLADVVERRLKGRLDEWRDRFRKNAFWWVLYGRLFPFSNSTVMSLLCGSCRIPYASFALGSFIGFIPLAVVFACYGSGGVRGDFLQIAIATGILILSIGSRRVLDALFPQGSEVSRS